MNTLVVADDTMASAEKACIVKAIKDARGNVALAAQVIDIGRATLYRKIKKYNINQRDFA